MTRFQAFLSQQRGNATVEFAFASLFLFGIIMVALDFGIYAQQNLKLGNAVEQGAVIAFNNRAGTVDTTSIGTYVAAAAGNSPTMSYQCNGGSCSGTVTSKCIVAPASAGGWPTFTDPTGSGSNVVCASGASPGYYLVIRARRTYHSVVVPNTYLSGGTMQQQAVVRLS